MEETITVYDDSGEITISYTEVLKYHGQDFYGGVVLALKVLKLAFEKLLGDNIPHRNKIHVVVGFNPPGVIDTIEFVTRAQTRHRLIVEPDPPKGPDSVFGRYYFEVHYEKRWMRLTLKEGMLPDGFTLLARKSFAGIATPEERARWTDHKKQIGKALMEMRPEEILDFEGPFESVVP